MLAGEREREREAHDEWELCGSGFTKVGTVQDNGDDLLLFCFLSFWWHSSGTFVFVIENLGDSLVVFCNFGIGMVLGKTLQSLSLVCSDPQ